MHTYACICAVLKYYLLCTIENHLKNQFNLHINESYEAWGKSCEKPPADT